MRKTLENNVFKTSSTNDLVTKVKKILDAKSHKLDINLVHVRQKCGLTIEKEIETQLSNEGDLSSIARSFNYPS